jgi:hypothetical protein
MNYSGFCFAKTRYLTDDEKILLAFNSTNRLTERRITVDGGKTHSVVKTIPYGSFEEFRKENPNCCTILVDKVRGFPSSNFFDRIIGNGYNVDELTLSALKRLRFLIQRVHLLRIPCKALNRGGSLHRR